MSEEPEIRLRQIEDYRFEIDFGRGLAPLQADEPPPIGGGQGPSPSLLLLSAVGTCLSSSFHFAMRKFRESPGLITATARATIGRDEQHHLRVQAIAVTLAFATPAASIAHLDRILEQFEQFCTVSAAVRRGIPITVSVIDGIGRVLK
ncbi:MAG: OsmC family protein [Rhodospirillales bacterium]|nr:OsmC family protein [Rhodospirillales bacterium]